MNFAEKVSELSKVKEERRISVDEFDEAVMKSMETIVDEMDLNDAKLAVLVPLTGMAFAGIMREILFGKERK